MSDIDVSKLNMVELAELAQTVAAEIFKQAAKAAAIADARSPAVATERTDAVPRTYTLKQIAEQRQVKEITITRRVARGFFPKPMDHAKGEHLRWRADVVDALRVASVFDALNAADVAACKPMIDDDRS